MNESINQKQEQKYMQEIYKDICSNCNGHKTIEFKAPEWSDQELNNIKYEIIEIACELCNK